MNFATNRTMPDNTPVTRLEIVLGGAFFGLMVAIAASMFFLNSASLSEQSHEAALVVALALCSAAGGILARGRLVLNGKYPLGEKCPE